MLLDAKIAFNLIKQYRGCEIMKINKVSIQGIGGIGPMSRFSTS